MPETVFQITRRSLMAAALPALAALKLTGSEKHVPVGLELYSVRDELKKDLPGTVEAVAKMGYECVEFYAPYYDWSLDNARLVRKQLDDLGVHCYSTHNSTQSFTPDGMEKAIELNQALGARYVVLAHPGEVKDLDGWKRIAEMLNKGNDAMAGHGLHAGYHNHDLEWKAIEGQRPMEILAA